MHPFLAGNIHSGSASYQQYTLDVREKMNCAAMRLSWKYLHWPLWLAAAIFLLLVVRHGITQKFDGASISPHNIYRLDYYKASPFQHIRHYEMAMPTFIRLYRIETEILMGESAMVNLWLNSKLHWFLMSPIHTVRLGSNVLFKNIPPKCIDCPPLTESQIQP